MTKYLLFAFITLIGVSLSSYNGIEDTNVYKVSNTIRINIDSLKNEVNNDIEATIEKRKALEKQVKELKKQLANKNNIEKDTILVRVKSFNDFKNHYKNK